MKKIFSYLAVAGVVVAMSACSNLEKMKNTDGITVDCTPEVLALVAGQVPATITVTYPENYFNPKATLVVTPVLVYEGGQQEIGSFTYQGSKVKENNKVISPDGGKVTEKVVFAFKEGMEKSVLELRSVARYKDQEVEIPAIKVADGVNVTCQLAETNGFYSFKTDRYEDVIRMTTEGQILYDVNSANVKTKELKSQSIKDLQKALDEMKSNERVTITGTQIVAYASPEGGESYNAKLSDKRAGSAEQAWEKIAKGMDITETEIKSIGQDWDGFREAVAASNIEDKDLILRVLSMYSDPAVRESEIRNMSQIFTELKSKVFPELRRARFITTGEYQNYSDEELRKLSEEHLNNLDEVSILHVAAITEDAGRKDILYRYVADRFNSQEALYDLAVLSLNNGKKDAAVSYLNRVDANDPDALNLKGVLAMRDGKYDEAVNLFKKSNTDDAKANIAAIDILRGDYASAAVNAKGVNAAVANLLTGNVDAAEKALTCKCAKADYLRAVVAARKGDSEGVRTNLQSAFRKNPSLEARADKDIEFANFR